MEGFGGRKVRVVRWLVRLRLVRFLRWWFGVVFLVGRRRLLVMSRF